MTADQVTHLSGAELSQLAVDRECLGALLEASRQLLEVAENDGILLDENDAVSIAIETFRDAVVAVRTALSEAYGA